MEKRKQPKTRFATFLLIAILVLSCCPTISAISNEQSPRDEDLQLEQMLNELLGTDPAIISDLELYNADPKQAAKFNCCEVKLGAGRKTNVLASNTLDLDSNLINASIDYSFSSGLLSSNFWSFYTFYQQTAYLDLDIEGAQYSFLTWIQNKRALTKSSFWGFDLEYANYTELDTSNAQEDEQIPQLRNSEVAVSLFWESDWDNNLTTHFAVQLSQFATDETSDEYNAAGFSALLTKKYQKRSDFRTIVKTSQQNFTDEETPDLDGIAIEGQKLTLTINSLGLQNNHYSVDNPGWLVHSDLELKTQRDNGPGYYNYNALTIKESIQYITDQWKFEGKGALRNLQYTKRKILSTSGNNEKMYIRAADIGLAFERKFNKTISLNTEIKQFTSKSNNETEDYTTGSLLMSVNITF